MVKNKLFYYRRERGLRQFELAERLGISEVRISRIETGRTSPTSALAERISGVLGVSVDDVFPESQDMKVAGDVVINSEEAAC